MDRTLIRAGIAAALAVGAAGIGAAANPSAAAPTAATVTAGDFQPFAGAAQGSTSAAMPTWSAPPTGAHS